MSKVLILGAYGNFGHHITMGLAKKNIPLILAGRNEEKLNQLLCQLSKAGHTSADTICIDAHNDIDTTLDEKKPSLVINTCGPFQQADYRIAESCINHGCHYIDLADGRDFVSHIKTLNHTAKLHNTIVISGASTVPALSSAVIEKFLPRFSSLNSMRYGITPGQKTPRGLATTKAILSYVGKKIPRPGSSKQHYGWQDLYLQKYPELGRRWMANCDIPDLAAFPSHYQIPSIQFSAGLESPTLHLSLWLLSWIVRAGLPINLQKHAKRMLHASHFFDRFSSDDGGMHMTLNGLDKHHRPLKLNWYIIAKSGDGPQIPAAPAIILADKIINKKLNLSGAMPCIGLVTYDEYLKQLSELHIDTHVELNQ